MSDEAEARVQRRLRLMVINGFGGFSQLELPRFCRKQRFVRALDGGCGWQVNDLPRRHFTVDAGIPYSHALMGSAQVLS